MNIQDAGAKILLHTDRHTYIHTYIHTKMDIRNLNQHAKFVQSDLDTHSLQNQTVAVGNANKG